MARSGSQSLRATQLGSRLIVRIRISGILCALTWSTRETPGFAGIQSSARPRQPPSATEDSLVRWRTQIWQLRNPKKRMDLPDPLTQFFKPMRSGCGRWKHLENLTACRCSNLL